MPLPKRKTSHSRTSRRRAANWKMSLPSVGECPRCRQPRLSHHVCLSCGFYGKRMVLERKTKVAAGTEGEANTSQD